jgi:hypothetical protein
LEGKREAALPLGNYLGLQGRRPFASSKYSIFLLKGLHIFLLPEFKAYQVRAGLHDPYLWPSNSHDLKNEANHPGGFRRGDCGEG